MNNHDSRGWFIKGHAVIGGFKKGGISWNKGKTPSEETRRKLSIANKGQYISMKQRNATRKALWRGNFVTYRTKHSWLVRNYGKANHCENPHCSAKSKKYDWANISGTYDRDIRHYISLCRGCHIKFDRYGSLKYIDIFKNMTT